MLCSLVAASASAQDSPLTIRAGVFSALIVRGLTLTEPGRPVFLVSADAYSPTGWSAGGSLMAMRSATGNEAGGWVIRARHDWALTQDWTVALAARHDAYFGDGFLRSWCYNQADATVGYGDVWALTGSWRPNGGIGCPEPTLKKPDFAVDFNAQWPLGKGIGVDVGAGRLFDGRWTGYDYGQLGVYASASALSLHIGHTWTYDADPASYGFMDKPRWVASAVWQF